MRFLQMKTNWGKFMTYDEEKEIISKIAGYLDKLEVSYQVDDIKTEKEEIVPIIYTYYKYRDFKFDLMMRNIGNWVLIKCFILDLEDFSDEQVLAVYEIGLALNYMLPETTFSAYERKLFVESDMDVGVSFEDFKRELYSIANGIDDFVDAIASVKGRLKDTLGKINPNAEKIRTG